MVASNPEGVAPSPPVLEVVAGHREIPPAFSSGLLTEPSVRMRLLEAPERALLQSWPMEYQRFFLERPIFVPDDSLTGPPRFISSNSVTERFQQWQAALPQYLQTRDLLIRCFPEDADRILSCISLWPEEYVLAFFAVVPERWESFERAQVGQAPEPDELDGPFGGITIDRSSQDLLMDEIGPLHALQDWFDSFYRPIGKGNFWRRGVGSRESAHTFHKAHRLATGGGIPFCYGEKNFRIDLGAIEKMRLWAEQNSRDWTLETSGFLVGEMAQDQEFLLTDFVPMSVICGDASYDPRSHATNSMSTGDPCPPTLMECIKAYLARGLERPEQSYPVRFGLHTHPLTGNNNPDRPSYVDLCGGADVCFMYAPKGRRLIAWKQSDLPIPDDYSFRPFAEMEAAGFFKTVLVLPGG